MQRNSIIRGRASVAPKVGTLQMKLLIWCFIYSPASGWFTNIRSKRHRDPHGPWDRKRGTPRSQSRCVEQLLYVTAHAQWVSTMDEILHLYTLPEGALQRMCLLFHPLYLILRLKQHKSLNPPIPMLTDCKRPPSSQRDPTWLQPLNSGRFKSWIPEGSS